MFGGVNALERNRSSKRPVPKNDNHEYSGLFWSRLRFRPVYVVLQLLALIAFALAVVS